MTTQRAYNLYPSVDYLINCSAMFDSDGKGTTAQNCNRNGHVMYYNHKQEYLVEKVIPKIRSWLG